MAKINCLKKIIWLLPGILFVRPFHFKGKWSPLYKAFWPIALKFDASGGLGFEHLLVRHDLCCVIVKVLICTFFVGEARSYDIRQGK